MIFSDFWKFLQLILQKYKWVQEKETDGHLSSFRRINIPLITGQVFRGMKECKLNDKNRLGEKVKNMRETRNLSIEDMAERAYLKEDGIKKIENGELIPGLTPLIKIARALGVRLGTFLDDQQNIGPVITRKDEKKGVTRFSDKDNPDHSDLDFYSLAQNKSGRHMEPFMVDIYPSSEDNYKLSSHEGEEFIYVMKGEVEIIYGKDTYLLKEGESIYYDSIVKHHVHSHGTEAAKILAVIYAPF